MVFLNIKDKKSLIGSISYQQTVMIHTKRVIFMILPLLFVPLVYGISITPDACAVPPDSAWHGSRTCGGESKNANGETTKTCCWKEGEVMYCQTCTYWEGAYGFNYDCKPKVAQMTTPPGPLTPGNLQNLPTLEQMPTTTPPLFGETPGGAEQPHTLTPTQPTPDTGGATTQPRPPQTVTPEIIEDDNQGGGLPNIQSRPNIQSEGEITAQPEDEESQNEDDGQEDSSEGAGPLT